MGFFPSKADNDIWMKECGGHYDHYVVVYVDNLMIASKDPEKYTKKLTKQFRFKLNGTGPTFYHLGIEYVQDKDGVLCMAPKKYIKKLLDSFV
jgi:hypothetical protein